MSDKNELDDILNELKSRKDGDDLPESLKSDVTEENTTDNQSTEDSKDEIKQEIVEEEPKTEPEPELKAVSIETPNEKENNDGFVDISSGYDDNDGAYPEDNMKGKSNKKIIIAIVAVIVVIAIGVGVYFAFGKSKGNEDETTTPQTTNEVTTEAEVVNLNPLTGETGYNESAIGKRPVACVVENASAARPQWGINTPDIIVEGEVEGGETRMLWIYADYTSLPEKIGPMRSARPPFIKFSELFDSIFIHWGQSKSKGSYVGANEVFENDDVDHINQMAYKAKATLFGRDKSRNVASEHTGVLYGSKLEQAIKEYDFRTDAKSSSYTSFTFNDVEDYTGTTACNKLSLKFSKRTATRTWTYSTDDKMYHCNDYKTDVKMKNLIVLFDKTTYVTKSNYKGSGSNETYCNYGLSGGKGVVAFNGTYQDITWSASNGVLEIKDANGNDVALKSGRSWIGYGSSNNGGTSTESAS